MSETRYFVVAVDANTENGLVIWREAAKGTEAAQLRCVGDGGIIAFGPEDAWRDRFDRTRFEVRGALDLVSMDIAHAVKRPKPADVDGTCEDDAMGVHGSLVDEDDDGPYCRPEGYRPNEAAAMREKQIWQREAARVDADEELAADPENVDAFEGGA